MSGTILVPEAKELNDGNSIPVLGMGVFKVGKDITGELVESGLRAGIRLVDTARSYENEEGVGEGVRRAGIPREELFITTKVANSEHGYEKAIASVEESLKRLQLQYIDLVLIHWPIPTKDLYVETYKALEKLRKDGLVRSIGVSNFQAEHLQRLMDNCEILPVLNQIELHPYFTNEELTAFCKANAIAVQAWSPIARGAVLEDEIIAQIAAAHGVSITQAVLRWHYQKGLLTIPKSSSIARVIENAGIFSFALSQEECEKISARNTNCRRGPDPAIFGSDA